MPAAGRRSLAGALAWAQSEVGDYGWRRLCLGFVRQSWGIAASGIFSAREGYSLTKYRHKDRTPPPGAPVWFDGPTSADHVALAKGNGKLFSNDVISPGRIDIVTIGKIEDVWGARYLGWSEDYPNFGKLPLDLIGSGGSGAKVLKIGDRVVVTTAAGLNARLTPNGKVYTTVAKGYRGKITKLAEAGGRTWARFDKFWYASQFLRKV